MRRVWFIVNLVYGEECGKMTLIICRESVTSAQIMAKSIDDGQSDVSRWLCGTHE